MDPFHIQRLCKPSQITNFIISDVRNSLIVYQDSNGIRTQRIKLAISARHIELLFRALRVEQWRKVEGRLKQNKTIRVIHLKNEYDRTEDKSDVTI